MRTNELVSVLTRIEQQEHDQQVLTEGSIARAMQMYTASNPRWQHCRFADLPRVIQSQILDLALFVETP